MARGICLKAVLTATVLALVRDIGLFSYCVVKAVGRWAMTHMSHAVQPEASRFQQLFPCSSMFRGGFAGPTLALLRCFEGWVLGRRFHKNATAGECRDQAEERRASIRGVRGIPLVCGLEDLSRRLFFIASRA